MRRMSAVNPQHYLVCHYVESYWGWADGLLNGREDAKNERS
nr:MAG TPA_asm: hypothetical protein [Caudoviricetes sp.]